VVLIIVFAGKNKELEYFSAFENLKPGEGIEVESLGNPPKGQKYFYDDYLGLEFYYPDYFEATAYKASDSDPYDTVLLAMTDSKSFEMSIMVSDCTPKYYEMLEYGETDTGLILGDYIYEALETYGIDVDGLYEYEEFSPSRNDDGSITYSANWYNDSTQAVSGAGMINVYEDIGAVNGMIFLYNVNEYDDYMSEANDLIAESLNSYVVAVG
jgi:hypothetical protein